MTVRWWTDEEIDFVYENYGLLTLKEIGNRLGRAESSVRGLIVRHQIPKVPAQREFAVYKGDKFLFIGTTDYACERLGITKRTFEIYRTPSRKKRSGRNSIHIVDLGVWKIEEEIS